MRNFEMIIKVQPSIQRTKMTIFWFFLLIYLVVLCSIHLCFVFAVCTEHILMEINSVNKWGSIELTMTILYATGKCFLFGVKQKNCRLLLANVMERDDLSLHEFNELYDLPSRYWYLSYIPFNVNVQGSFYDRIGYHLRLPN